MSDLPTPETDAEVMLCHGIPNGFTPPKSSYVSSKFARKLERERDEAIRARDVALKVAHTYDEAHTKACEGWAQAERERDKLRDASSRILVAINKLTVGAFSLLESEYNQLMKVTYGRD